MHKLSFDQPVTILVGMGFPARIDTVMRAYSLLQDWPNANRNHGHRVALDACRACIAGEIDAESVRAILVGFARGRDVLVEHLVPVAPAALAACVAKG